jgi:hypothetical protein
MFTRLAAFREYFSLLSIRGVKKWFLIVVAAFGYFLLTSGSYAPSYIDALFTVAASIGWLIATGLPFLLGASLIICSEQTKNNIAERMSKGGKVRFLLLFVSYTLLIMISMAIISLAGLLFAFFTTGSLAILQLLPQLLILSLVVSFLISPAYLLLALSVDSTRLSIIIGLAFSFAIIIATGTPRYPVNHPEIAFLEPAHLLSALLFVTIGGFGQYAVEYNVGTLFQLIDLILPIVILIIISVLSFYGSNKVFSENLPRWSLEWNDWLLREQSTLKSDKTDQLGELRKARINLDARRKKVIALAIAAIIAVPFSFISYAQVRRQEWTQVVYESPSGGETLTIDEWDFGSFTGVEPSPSIFLSVGCSGRIVDWTGGSGLIEYVFEHRAMTLIEFQGLNETEFDDLFGHSLTTNYGTIGTFGGGWSGPIDNQEYVWVLKFTNVNGRTSGSVSVWFQVVISAI